MLSVIIPAFNEEILIDKAYKKSKITSTFLYENLIVII